MDGIELESIHAQVEKASWNGGKPSVVIYAYFGDNSEWKVEITKEWLWNKEEDRGMSEMMMRVGEKLDIKMDISQKPESDYANQT